MRLARLQHLALFVEMFVNVIFVMSCLYSAVNLTRVRKQGFIRNYVLLLLRKVPLNVWGRTVSMKHRVEWVVGAGGG